MSAPCQNSGRLFLTAPMPAMHAHHRPPGAPSRQTPVKNSRPYPRHAQERHRGSDDNSSRLCQGAGAAPRMRHRRPVCLRLGAFAHVLQQDFQRCCAQAGHAREVVPGLQDDRRGRCGRRPGRSAGRRRRRDVPVGLRPVRWKDAPPVRGARGVRAERGHSPVVLPPVHFRLVPRDRRGCVARMRQVRGGTAHVAQMVRRVQAAGGTLEAQALVPRAAADGPALSRRDGRVRRL